MREVKAWESFDGELFLEEEKCKAYEEGHIFYNPEQICFYSNYGKKIPSPNEQVFLDSNRFKVFTLKALKNYQNYCKFLHIAVPHIPEMELTYPLHYVFVSGAWQCMEEQIVLIKAKMAEEFQDEYENSAMTHGLVTEDDG